MQRINWQQTLSGLAVIALILGCSQTSQPSGEKNSTGTHFPGALSQLARQTQPVARLSAEKVGKTVQVEGTVLQQAPLLEKTLYQIEDTTGQLWVLSTDASPNQGDIVRVSGSLRYEEVVINGADIGDYYLEETSRSVLSTSQAQ